MSCNPINPVTGLPMTSDSTGGVDAGGSPWGTDIHSVRNPWSSSGWENNL